MDIKALNEFVIPYLVPDIPTEPGLYLYLRNNQKGSNKVDIVEIRLEKGFLIAESDNWDSYLPVNAITKYYPGKWSKKIYFEK